MNATCTVLTPPGRGAVGVVEVAGPDREAAVDALFVAASGRRLSAQPIDSVRFGRWGSEQGEEVVVVRRREVVEVHCHGGRAASAAIVASLGELGVAAQTQQQWLVEREPSPLRRAARQALELAKTERVALVLLDQWQGALEREIEQVLDQLRRDELHQAQTQLARLLATWQVGRWLTRPARVVLTGPPNVGKSSLINRLVGYERAIVFDQPGTTRDVVTAETAIDGWPVVLSDTAGIRQAGEEIELAGIERARGAVASADLVIEVTEAEEVCERGMPPTVAREGTIVVANKVDRIGEAQRAELGGHEIVVTSATNGEGIAALLNAIGDHLVPEPLEPGRAVLFRQQELDVVAGASGAITAGDVALAQRQLELLLAEFAAGGAID